MRAVLCPFLLFLLVASLLSSAVAQTLPFSLQRVGSVNVTGVPQAMIVRNEQYSVTGSVNAIQPGTAAVNALNNISHFIVIVFNQESYDSVMGGYRAGNSLSNPNGYTPPYVPQIQRPTNVSAIALSNSSTAFPLYSFPQDAAATVGNATFIPNAPLLYNQYLSTSTSVSRDPPHGYQQVIYKVNGGRMDSFVWTAGTAGAVAMGHWNLTGFTLYALASQYTLFDNFFASAFGGPLLNHLYLVGGRSVAWDNGRSSPPLVLSDGATLAYHNYSTTDGILSNINQEGVVTYPDNFLINNVHAPGYCGAPSFPLIDDATINGGSPANLADQLSAAGVSWGYYAQDWSSLAAQAANSSCTSLGNDTHLSPNVLPLTHYARFNSPSSSDSSTHLQDLDGAFFAKLQATQLESVVWVQPDSRYDWSGGTVDPYHSDRWLSSTMQAIFASRHWANNDTLVLLTFSNADGFYDHVPPYAGDRFGPGLRVATIAISPYHTGGVVNSNRYEHLSIIKMIQTRFGLAQSGGSDGANPLMGKARDQAARDLANSFNEGAAGNVTRPNGAASARLSKGGGVAIAVAVTALVGLLWS